MDILKWIREQSHLQQVSVVVLSSSGEDRDIVKAYQLGARSYLVKPPTRTNLLDVVNAVCNSANVHAPLQTPGEKTASGHGS